MMFICPVEWVHRNLILILQWLIYATVFLCYLRISGNMFGLNKQAEGSCSASRDLDGDPTLCALVPHL